MRFLPTTVFVVVIGFGAATAWGQLGLYGSPDVLPMGHYGPAAAGYANPAVPSAWPGTQAVQGYAGAGQSMRQHYPQTSPMVPAAPNGPYAFTPRKPAPPQAPQPKETPLPPIPEGSPDLVDRMLEDQADCADGGCEQPEPGCFSDCQGGFPESCCPWYASASVLVMGRNQANRVWTTYRSSDASDQEMHTAVGTNWSWGGEIRFGRRFCCGQKALEARYWTLEPFEGFDSVSRAAGVSTPLIFSGGNIQFGGSPAQNWFDQADEHRVWRRSEVHSVEFDLVCLPFGNVRGMPWDVNWAVGVRYFRFEDDLTFGSLIQTGSWSDPGDAAYLRDQIINNMIGVQLSVDARYNFFECLSVFITPRLGVYENHITNNFQLSLGDGTVATQSAYPGDSYPVRSSKDVVSFLGQIDVGADWQFGECWSARVGYRALFATGMGMADHQIPTYVTDTPEIRAIDHNGNLVLHGAFVGMTYNF